MAGEKLYRDPNLLIVFGVTLTAVLAVSSIAPALPTIRDALGISDLQVGLLITAFTFPGMVLAPFLGVLADRYGRKRILVPSLFLFGIAGTACALAPDFNTLVTLRVFQGVGGAALGSINTTVIGDMYAGRQRAAAMGLNASVLNVGTAAYPLIGGALAALAWFYPFYLSLIAIPVGILVITRLRNPEPRNREGLKEYLGGTWGYLKNRKVVALFAAGVLTFVILYGAYLTYLPLLLYDSFQASDFSRGLIMSFMALTTAAVASQLGRITGWLSETMLIRLAFILYAVALAMVPLMPSMWLLLVPIFIFGIAHGVNMPSIQTQVAGLAPLEYRAAFMSINSTMLRLGQTIGPPLVGLFYVFGGTDAAFYATAGLALLAAAIALLIRRTGGSPRADE
ncbi:MAG: MFS transporter [Chloroflexota bacterium]|nr:MFS transporter [Chloroflexota bacterium]